MNLLTNLALLSALTLPLAAQRYEPTNPPKTPPPAQLPLPLFDPDTQSEPPVVPDQAADPTSDLVPEFSVDLTVDHAARLATMNSHGTPFFGFMIAATHDKTLDIPGIGGLLVYEAIVATALCNDGVMALDLGVGGWGFDVYLQGVAISELGAAMTSIEVVSDKADTKK